MVEADFTNDGAAVLKFGAAIAGGSSISSKPSHVKWMLALA